MGVFDCTLIAVLLSIAFAAVEICNEGRGVCKPLENCEAVSKVFNQKTLWNYCNSDLSDERVCCPTFENPALLSSHISERKCHSDYGHWCITPLVRNGTTAVPGEFPFMALIGIKLGKKIEWKCGGALIHPEYVLTAAHCLNVEDARKEDYVVRLGEHDLNNRTKGSPVQEFNVSDMFEHPDFDIYDTRLCNDIGILKLDKAAVFNDFVQPACLPIANGTNYKHYTAAGWGLMSNKTPATILQKIDLQQVSPCGDLNRTSEICAGRLDKTGDTASGDSGGPLFTDHPNHGMCLRYMIVGIYIEDIVWPQNVGKVEKL